MRRIIAALGNLNWKRAYALFVLCSASAIALPAQTLTTLHSFDNTDGAYPLGVLFKATDGEWWGATWRGGANGEGTLFKITPSGTFTPVYSFCSESDCADGTLPGGGLIQAPDGNLYGTASYGGANGYGTVFKISLSGNFKPLHSFNGVDGAYPVVGLVRATNGNFYGSTANGGANGTDNGTVFDMTPDGTLTSLYTFCSQNGARTAATPTRR